MLRRQSSNPIDFKIGIETSHNLLVDFLLDLGYEVYVLNPGSMKAIRQQYRPSGAKDDAFDALVLAIALLHNQYCWRHLDIGTKPVREVRILVRDHLYMIKMRTAITNTLTAALKMYYPEYFGFFSNVCGQSSLAFLQAYPSFENAQALAFDELKKFFNEQKAYKVQGQKIYNILHQPHIHVPQPLRKAKELRAQNCIHALLTLNEDIKLYEQQLQRLVKQHADGVRFMTFPGVGFIGAARLLALFGDNRKLYSHVSQLQGLAGICPVTEQTGNSIIIHFRRACNKFHRYAITQIAKSSLKHAEWPRAYFQKRRAKGNSFNHALRCLANIELRILFAMWKNKTDYDESTFLAQKASHQIKTELNQL
jgi:transposase